jgi:hypothetical protein
LCEERTMTKLKALVCAIATCLLAGCSTTGAGTNDTLPVVYGFFFLNIPNEGAFSHDYGPEQETGRKVRKFLKAQSADLTSSNLTHVTVELLPFSHSQTCQRPFDLRLAEAKLDVFINWMADKKIQFLPDRMEQIPLEKIEDTLHLMCREIGIKSPTIMRGMGWRARKTHNQAPEDTARKLADPQR